MSRKKYVPRRGDVVYLDFNPVKGHEQAGRRTALVLSPVEYNRQVKLAVVCAITNQEKGYPFEVALPASDFVSGVALADQVRCVSWQERNAEFVCTVDEAVVDDVVQKLLTLVGPKPEED